MSLLFKDPPQNICLIRLSAIGDVTHVVPVIRNLQQHWPGTAITWIIGKIEYSLVRDLPGVEFIVFEKNQGLASYRTLHHKLKGRRFDILLHMQVSLRASIASLLVKAPVRIGFDKARAKNGQWLFTNRRIAPLPRQHVLDGFLEFIRFLGITIPTIEWNIPIPPEDREKTMHWVGDNTPFLVINPSSSTRVRNWRNWDAQAYAMVADYAAKRYNLLTVLTGGPLSQEIVFADAIEQLAESKIVNVVGKTSLKELQALLDRAVAVISPDTGPAHMANAAGTPVIGLYASSNPERTGPYSFRELTVNRYPDAVRQAFQKSVQEVPWGKRVRDPQVMNQIKFEEVKNKLDQVVSFKFMGNHES
jgi:heptosyltransferase I